MRRFFPPLALALAVLAGCGPAAPVACHPAHGQIFYDGKPAAGVRVYLMPTSAPMPPAVPTNPSAVTDADGRFDLSTRGNKDGAAEGGYQIVLSWPDPSAGREEDESDRLMGWYDAAHSRLSAHIKAGTNELPAIRLPAVTQPPRPSEGVPGRN